MTTHSFDAWQESNGDKDNAREPAPADAAVNTLRDILALTQENLPATAVAARVQAIARAALARLGVAVPVEVEDLGGPSGQCFPDDDTAFIGPALRGDAELPF